MKQLKIIIISIIFLLSFNQIFAETSSFITNDMKTYCEQHMYDYPYTICSQDQLDRNDLVDAGFSGPIYMEIGSGSTVTGKICVENGKEVNESLCKGEEDEESITTVSDTIKKDNKEILEKKQGTNLFIIIIGTLLFSFLLYFFFRKNKNKTN